jgi:ATP-dependent helicase HrpB
VNLVYLHLEEKGEWPDLSEQALLDSLETWLGPYLDGVNSMKDVCKLDLSSILKSLLPWSLSQQLESLAPSVYPVPSGSKISLDYLQSPPVLAVKLQEMFGCAETPSIINGRVKLLVHLLSPAKRPLQVTQDLAGFWGSSYNDVKKELKGRYPKHPWPDDPMSAVATSRVKPR